MSYPAFVFLLECGAAKQLAAANAVTLGMSDSDDAKLIRTQLASLGMGRG
jgi:hypothetical protein